MRTFRHPRDRIPKSSFRSIPLIYSIMWNRGGGEERKRKNEIILGKTEQSGESCCFNDKAKRKTQVINNQIQ